MSEKPPSPQIDVILPTYNRRRYLPRAIECMTAQTFRDWRLLVVNDGGDDVADIVEAAGDSRIALFSRPHLGKAAQLNFALSQATAPYIAYMDDDDEVFPEHLEKLHAAAIRAGADFVYSDTYLTLLDPQGRVIRREVEPCRDMTPDAIRVFNCINHKQILHARTLAAAVGGYDEGMKILIDYDGIKRLAAAARRPFHLREATGEHFLRMDAATGSVSSISGLWTRDPAEAGRSLLRFFSKDPAALASLYRSVPKLEAEVSRLRGRLDGRPSARLRRLLRKRRGCGCFLDALPPDAEWRDATPEGGIGVFFEFSDETDPVLAAVNKIAAGDRSPDVRKTALGRLPAPAAAPRFSVSDVDGGLRFVHSPGTPMRWAMLTSSAEMPDDFAFEFDYVPRSVFTEQLQIDFRMASLGDRLRLMVRDNTVLVANSVADGRFAADERTLPFSFETGRPAKVRFELRGGVCALSADGRCLLSLDCSGFAEMRGGRVALVFYEAGEERPIDFEIRNFRLFAPR